MSAAREREDGATGGREDIAPAYLKFFDDAAVFPPGSASLDRAIHDWYARERSPLAEVTGPLVLRPGDLSAAQDLVRRLAPGRALPVVVVAAVEEAERLVASRRILEPEVSLVGLELTARPSALSWDEAVHRIREVAAEVPVAVELDARQMAADSAASLVELGIIVKFRAGGLDAALFPTPETLGSMVHEAVRRGVPFKLTAGLHQAVRHTNPQTGLTHHGFLNVALAVEKARNGEDLNAVVEALRQTDGDALSSWAQASDGVWRESFRSFGTCSVREPLESLAQLGLFPAALLHDEPTPR